MEPSGTYITSYIQPGFVDQTSTADGPAPHHVGIVTDPVTFDADALLALAVAEAPAIMQPPTEHIEQTVMLGQRLYRLRCAVPLQVLRSGAQHAAVGRGHW